MSVVVTLQTQLYGGTGTPFQYNLDLPCLEIYNQAKQNLKLPNNVSYNLLLTDMASVQQWITADSTLRQLNARNGMLLVLYEASDQAANTNQQQSQNQTQNLTNNVPTPTQNNESQFNSHGSTNSTNEFSSLGGSFDSGQFDFNTNIGDYQTNLGFGDINSVFDSSNQVEGKGYLFTICDGFNGVQTQPVKLLLNYNFEETLRASLNALHIRKIGRYILMFEFSNGSRQYFEDNQYIESYSCYDGMKLYVFNRDTTIKVYTPHSYPKLITVDLMERVFQIAREIGNVFMIPNFMNYTLFAKEDDKEKPLELKSTILEQTKNITEMRFQRNWFIFSCLDFFDFKTSMDSYLDAKAEFLGNDLPMCEEDALQFASLCYLAETPCDEGKRPPISDFPDDCSQMLPASYEGADEFGKILSPYINDCLNIMQFEAMRDAISFMKHFPGFSCETFEAQVIIKDYSGSQFIDCIVEVGPLRVAFYNKETNVLEERVSYTSIIELETLGDLIDIHFSLGYGKSARYEISSEEAEHIKNLIETYIYIIQETMSERQKFAYILNNKGNSKRNIMLYTTNTFAEKSPREFSYPTNITGHVLISIAEMNIGIQHNDLNVGLMKISDDTFRWVNNERIISIMNLKSGMTLCIMPKIAFIHITFVNGEEATVKLDITKNICDLTDSVFEQVNQDPLYGFTFWSMNQDGTLRALDFRKSIPEQVPNYSKLVFRRRFYILSYEVLQSPISAQMAVYDCDTIIKGGKLQMDDEQCAELLVLSAYAKGKIKKLREEIDREELRTILPDYILPTRGFIEKLQKKANGKKKYDPFSAAKKFCGNIRQIKGFGFEDFPVATYLDITNKRKRENVIMSVGPLFVNFYMPGKESEPFRQISYRLIIKYQTMQTRMRIKFVSDNKGNISIIEIRINEEDHTDGASMVLTHSIRITYLLLIERQRRERKIRAETIRRLRGGYTDESGRIYGPMLDLYVTTNLTKLDNLTRYWIEVKTTGDQIVQELGPSFNLSKTKQYACILKYVDRLFLWIDPKRRLVEYSPYRGQLMGILERYQTYTITFWTGQRKEVKKMDLDITKTIHDLTPFIAEQFHVEYPIGFTLWLAQEGQWIPLDTTRTIVEQTPGVYDFTFARRFLPEGKSKIDDDDIIAAYKTAKDTFQKGGFKAPEDAVSLLAYLQAAADNNTTKPSDDQISNPSCYPIGYKGSKDANKARQLASAVPIKDKKDAMKQYIDKVRDIPNYGGGVFPVKTPEKPMNFWVSGDGIKLTDPKLGNVNEEIPFSNIVDVRSTPDEFAIKYKKPTGEIAAIQAKTDVAQRAALLIKANNQFHHDVMDNARFHALARDDLDNPSRDTNLKTTCLVGVKPIVKKLNIIDIKTPEELDNLFRKEFKLPNCVICALLLKRPLDYVWILPEELVGYNYLIEDTELFVFPNYVRIKVHDVNGREELFQVDITQPVYKLIPYIAWRYYVYFWNGYTLFDETNNAMTPLDLTMSIFQQIQNPTSFLFKRRFLMITKDDAKSDELTPEVFENTKKEMLNGLPKLNEKKSFEFAVYSIIAQLKEGESPTSWRGSAKNYIPATYHNIPKLNEKLSHLLSKAPKMTPQTALKKYVSGARQILHFGCTAFEGKYEDKDPENPKKMKERSVMVSVGPIGIHLYDKTKRNKDYAKVSYKSVIFNGMIGDSISLRIVDKEGAITPMTIRSPDAEKATELITQYRVALLPLTYSRENVQSMASDDFYTDNINTAKGDGVILKLSEWVEDPKPNKYHFSMTWGLQTTIRMCLFYLGIEEDGEYIVFYVDENKEFRFFTEGNYLQSLMPTLEGCLYILPKKMRNITQTDEGFYLEPEYIMDETILAHIQNHVQDYNIGSHIGFTLYDAHTLIPKPLDWFYILPKATPYWHELLVNRRFYVFTIMMLQNPKTTKKCFNDCLEILKDKDRHFPNELVGRCATYMWYFKHPHSKDKPKFTKEEIKSLTGVQNVVPEDVEEFTKYFTSLLPMIPEVAEYKLLCHCQEMPEFVAERYSCKYTNFTVPQYGTDRPVVLSMNPLGIFIYPQNSTEKINDIYWRNISVYSFNKTTINVSYEDENGFNNRAKFFIENNFDETLSYINDIFDLFRQLATAHDEIAYDVDDKQELKVFMPTTVVEDYNDYNNDPNDYYINLDYIDPINIQNTDIEDNSIPYVDQDSFDIPEPDWKSAPEARSKAKILLLISSSLESVTEANANLKKGKVPSLDLIKSIADRVQMAVNQLKPEEREKNQKLLDVNAKLQNYLAFVTKNPDKADAEALKAILAPLKEAQSKANADANELKKKFKKVKKPKDTNGIIGSLIASAANIADEIANNLLVNADKLQPLDIDSSKSANIMSATGDSFANIQGLIAKAKPDEQIGEKLLPLLMNLNAAIRESGAVSNKISSSEDKNLGELNKLLTEFQNAINTANQLARKNKTQKEGDEKYRLFLGNVSPLDAAIKAIQEDIEKLEGIRKAPGVAKNAKANSTADVALMRLNKSLTAIKNGQTELAHDPTKTYPRISALQGLIVARNTVDSISAPIKPALKGDKNNTNALKKIEASHDPIENAIISLATISITPNILEQIVDDCTSLAMTMSNIPILHVEKLNQEDQAFIKETIKLLDKDGKKIKPFADELRASPANGKVMMAVQRSLINLCDNFEGMHEIAKTLSDITLDQSYIMMEEDLEKHVKSALLDSPFTEPIKDTRHLDSIMQAQVDIARCSNNLAKANDTIKEPSIVPLFEKLKSEYFGIITGREMLSERPFNPAIIARNKEQLERMELTLGQINNIVPTIKEKFPETELTSCVPKAIVSVKEAIKQLSGAALGEFRVNPTKDLFQRINDKLQEIIKEGEALGKTPELLRDRKLQSILANHLSNLGDKKGEIAALSAHPSQQFYSVLPSLIDELKTTDGDMQDSSSYRANNKMHDLIMNLLSDLEIARQATSPNIDNDCESFKNCIDALNELSNALKNDNKDNGKGKGKGKDKDKGSKETSPLDGVLSQLASLAANATSAINDNLAAKPVTANELNDANLWIGELQDAFANLPKKLLSSLPPEKQQAINDSIIDCNNQFEVARKCTRLLPTSYRIPINTKPFVRITKKDEIEDGLLSLGKMIEALNEIFNELKEEKHVKEDPRSEQTFRDLSLLLGNFKPELLSDLTQEKPIIKMLDSMRESMPVIIKNARVLSGIINNEDLTTVTRIVSDNTNELLTRMNQPHMTLENAKEFSRLFIPLVIHSQTATAAFAKSNDVMSDPELANSIDDLIKSINELMNEFDNKRPGQKQNICDSFYDRLNNLIPLLQTNSKFEPYLQQMAQLHNFLGKYTTLPKVTLRLSDSLNVRPPLPIMPDKLMNLFYASVEIAESDKDKTTTAKVDPLINGLQQLIQSNGSVPDYLLRVSKDVKYVLPALHTIHASDSARIFALAEITRKQRQEYLEYLAVKISVKSTKFIKPLNDSFNKFMEQIKAKGIKLNEEQAYYSSQLDKNFKDADFNLLHDCPSLSAYVLCYQDVNKILKNSNLLIKSTLFDQTIAPLTSKFQADLTTYILWNNESEVALYELFFFFLTSTIQECESIMEPDDPSTMQTKMLELTRKWVGVLKNDTRALMYSKKEIKDAAKDMIEFKTSILTTIDKTLPDSSSKTELNRLFTSIECIMPIIRIWESKQEECIPQEIRASVEASLVHSLLASMKGKDILNGEHTRFPFVFSPVFAEFSAAQNIIQTQKESVKSLQEIATLSSKCFDDITKCAKLRAAPDIEPQIASIIQQILKMLQMTSKIADINFVALQQVDVQLLEARQLQDIENIQDKNCLATAKEAAKMMQEAQKSLDGCGNNTALIEKQEPNIAAMKAQDVAKKSTKIKALIELQLNTFLFSTNNSVFKVLPDKFTTKTVEAAIFAQNMMKELNSNLHYSVISQRIKCLQQQQISEFPDVVKMIQQRKHSTTEAEFTAADIEAAHLSIEKQLKVFSKPDELAAIQLCLKPEEMICQQLILSDISSLIQRTDVPFSIGPYISAIIQLQQKLFETVLISQAKTPIIPKIINPLEVQRVIGRYIEIAEFITQLITIQQSLFESNLDVYSLVKSPEGSEFITCRIPMHELIEQHKQIEQELELINSPQMLALFQSKLLPEAIIKQIRIIHHMIALLNTEYGEIILSREDVSASVQNIFKEVCNEQSLKVKADSNCINSLRLVQTNEFAASQSRIFANLSNIGLIQRLFTIQQQQAALNPFSTKALTEIETAVEQSPAKVKREIPSIVAQLQASDNAEQLTKLVTKLTTEQLRTQQQIIQQIISIISVPEQLSLVKNSAASIPVLDTTIAKIMKQLMKLEKGMVSPTPIVLNSINPIQDSNVSSTCRNAHLASVFAQRSQEISSLMTIIIANCDSIKEGKSVAEILGGSSEKEAKQKKSKGKKSKASSAKKSSSSSATEISPEKTEECQGKIVQMNYLLKSNPDELEAFVVGIPEDEKIIIYSMLQQESAYLKETASNKDAFAELAEQSNIFDRVTLLQRMPTTGILAKPPTTIDVPKDLDKLAQTEKIAYIASSLAAKIATLEQQRTGLYPELGKKPSKSALSSALSKIKINRLQSSISSQLAVVYKPDELGTELTGCTSQERLVQQMLIADLLKRVRSEDSLKDIEVSKSASDKSITDSILKAQVKAQKDQIVKDPQSILKMKPTPVKEIEGLRLSSSEQVQRKKLRLRLLLILDAISNAYPKAKDLATGKDAAKVLKDVNVEGLIQIQDMIKSLFAVPKSKEGIERSLGKVKMQTAAQILLVTQDLITRVTPGSGSLFDLPIDNSVKVDVRSGESKAPSDGTMYSSFAEAASELVNAMQKFLDVDMTYCKTVLGQALNDALDILNELSENRTNQFNQQVMTLLSLCPNLIASLTRVLPTISGKIKKELISDPMIIMKNVQELVTAASNLKDPKSAEKYRQMLRILLQIISKIEVALDPTFIKIDPFDAASALVVAIQEKDIPRMSKEALNFELMNLMIIAGASLDPVAPKLIEVVSGIQKTIAGINKSNKIAKADQESLNAAQKAIIKILIANMKSLFKILAALKTPDGANKIISSTSEPVYTRGDVFIKSALHHKTSTANEALQDVICQTTKAMAAASAGFQLADTDSYQVYTIFAQQMNNVCGTLASHIGRVDASVLTPLITRRAQRSFIRMINKMSDLILDAKEKEKVKNDLDKKRIAFAKSALAAARFVLTTASSRAQVRIPEIYKKLVEGENEVLKGLVSDMKKAGTKVAQSTKDLSASEALTSDIMALCKACEEFGAVMYDFKKVPSVTVTITQTSKVGTALLITINSCANLMIHGGSTSDTSSSQNIPTMFVIPTIQEAESSAELDTKQFKKAYEDTVAILTPFKEGFAAAKNTENANKLNDLCSKMSKTLEITLRVSTKVSDSKLIDDLSNTINTTVFLMNRIIRITRCKFMLVGDWEKSHPSAFKELEKIAKELSRTTLSAIKTYQEEDKLKKKFAGQFDELINPLAEASKKLEKVEKSFEKVEDQQAKTWASKVLNIGSTLSSSVIKILTHSKEHPTALTKPESLIEFSKSLINGLTIIEKSVKGIAADPKTAEDKVIESMAPIISLGGYFADSKEGGTPEQERLVHALVGISRSAKTLSDSAKSTRDAKNASKSKKSKSGSKLKTEVNTDAVELRKPRSKDDLMQRLILEAKVIQASYLLEKYEQKLVTLK